MTAAVVCTCFLDFESSSLVSVACVVLTVSTVAPLAWIVPHLKDRLTDPERLQEDRSETAGVLGVTMAAIGVLNVAFHVYFCVSLWVCDQKVLFWCSTCTAAITFLTTVFLMCSARSEFLKDDTVAEWYRSNGKAAAFVLILSATRLDTMALLRTFGAPLRSEHFQWIRYAGIFHCVVEDLSHILIASIKLTVKCDEEEDLSLAFFTDKPEVVALVKILLSALLMLASLVDKHGQMQAHRAARRGVHLMIFSSSRLEREITAPEGGQREFNDKHFTELTPRRWKSQRVGKGSFGTVYTARWREQDVAVKVMKLPEESHGATPAAKQQLKTLVEKVTRGFEKEVTTCCVCVSVYSPLVPCSAKSLSQ